MQWRTHPKLKGRFHAEQRDDLQVIVHDGGPRITDKSPEVVWVRTTGCDGDVFVGTVLNGPTQLDTVHLGQQIHFIMPAGSKHPVLATDKYLRERPSWTIHPCQKCGFTELFDAPSDLVRVVFPKLRKLPVDDPVVEAFTSFCPLCGGVQSVEFKETGKQARQKKAWWQFWK